MKKKKLKILYEDKFLIAVEKVSGLLTISDGKEYEKTLYHEVMLYLKQKNKNNKVFIIHRLDKDTSGIVLFAKSEKTKKIMQDNWQNVKREYIALVNGNVKNDQGIVKSYLKETKTFLTYSTDDPSGKLAITEYKKLASNKLCSLLKINIKTGRKNQIRVHLNDIGHSIVGDKKYGKVKYNPFRRLCLHASLLEFNHPVTGNLVSIECKYPKIFDII